MKVYVDAQKYAEELERRLKGEETPFSVYCSPLDFHGTPFDIREAEVEAAQLERDGAYVGDETFQVPGPLVLGRAVPLARLAQETVKILKGRPGLIPRPGHAAALAEKDAVCAPHFALSATAIALSGPATAQAKESAAGQANEHTALAVALEDKASAAAAGFSAIALAAGRRGHAAASGFFCPAVALGEGWAVSARGTAASLGGSAVSAGSHGLALTVKGEAHARGHQGKAAAIGEGGAALAGGPWAEALAWGENGQAETADARGLALALGRGGRAKGALGSWLVLAQRNRRGKPTVVTAVRVDGMTIRPDVWYTLERGRVVPAGDL